MSEFALPDEQLEDLAQLVAELVQGQAMGPQLVDADQVARRLAVAPSWVRQHAEELGGVPLGEGARPRWRFDLAVVMERVRARSGSERSEAPDPVPPRGRPRRRRPNRAGEFPLLPVAGRSDGEGSDVGA